MFTSLLLVSGCDNTQEFMSTEMPEDFNFSLTYGRYGKNQIDTFRLIDVVERDSVNVNTKKHIIIPAHKRIKFVADKDLQAKVNAEYADLQVEMLDPIEKTWIEKLKIKIFK